jgi:GNAT superfamily N-acetyltransferase
MPVLVDLTGANVATLPCCGMNNPAHEGRRRKSCWLRTHLAKGLRAKVAVTPEGRQCAYIEYLPGEYAWRGVDARGYLFIHCVFTFYRQYQSKGLAGRMLRECLADARAAGMKGVAVVARKGPWLAGPALYLENGFEAVDTAPPDYQLLVRKLDPGAANPSFKGGWEKKVARYGRGLTLIRSDQCPQIARFADEIAQAAGEEYGLKPKIVELKTHRDAQNAPTPYAVFALIRDGRLLADHPISRTRFRNIMRGEARPAAR